MAMILVKPAVLLLILSVWNGVKGFNHFKFGSSLICSKSFSMGIFKGVKFTIFFKRLELTFSLFGLGE